MVKKSDRSKKVVLMKEGAIAAATKRKPLENYVKCLEVAEPVVYGGLSVFPVYADKTAVHEKLVVMAEALKQGWLEIKDTGTVSELEFNNKSDKHILIMEGEIVKGGKQDRVVNMTFIMNPNSIKKVPTSCIQAHRWTGGPVAAFAASGEYVPVHAKGVLMASVSDSMCSSGGESYRSNQNAMWKSAANYLSDFSADKDGSANVLQAYQANDTEIKEILDKVNSSLEVTKDMVGMVCLIRGEYFLAEMFDDNQFLKAQKDKLLRSGIIEYLRKKEVGIAGADVKVVIDYLTAVENLSESELKAYKTPGEGISYRFAIRGTGISGSALLYKDGVIHMSLAGTIAEQHQSDPDGPSGPRGPHRPYLDPLVWRDGFNRRELEDDGSNQNFGGGILTSYCTGTSKKNVFELKQEENLGTIKDGGEPVSTDESKS